MGAQVSTGNEPGGTCYPAALSASVQQDETPHAEEWNTSLLLLVNTPVTRLMTSAPC